ncbi:chromodomain-helicase-DNA-binding protein 8-like isoform X2 [Tubulanus polymorphus]|uniref:chromodomain-helicase-DNA-binding protein 8-like isoform X2 n=1 Tax=Tubulanus polymorphus TaxID=672921 RepID=UPI003DA60786
MSDESLLSLFNSGSDNFLDGLTGNATGIGQPPGGNVGGMMQQGGMMLNTNMQPQGNFGQQNTMAMGTPTQKLHHYNDHEYHNYSQAPQQNAIMSPQHNQFGSPPNAGHMQANYGNMQPVPTSPQTPQMGMNQTQMWGQDPSMRGYMQQPQQYAMQQAPQPMMQQQPVRMPQPAQMHIRQANPQMMQQNPQMGMQQQPQQQQSQQQAFISHHDYASPMPNAGVQATTQRLTHFPAQQQANQFRVQNVSSSPNQNRIQVSSISNINSQQQHTAVAGGLYQQASQAQVQLTPSTQQQQQNFQQQAQMTAGQQQQQHYSYQQQPAQGMNEAPPLSHYPKTSPATQQYQQSGYQNIAVVQHPPPSPRPTPPPQSRTPTVNQNQAAYVGQTSLQQLEQMVPSHGTNTIAGTNTAANYPQTNQSTNQMQIVNNQQTFTINTAYNQINGNAATGVVTAGSANNIAATSQATNAQNTSAEIQQLQSQIQQLYSMPQNPQTQQNMLDLQERVRILKANQQQQVLQQQRQIQQHVVAAAAAPQPQTIRPVLLQTSQQQPTSTATTTTSRIITVVLQRPQTSSIVTSTNTIQIQPQQLHQQQAVIRPQQLRLIQQAPRSASPVTTLLKKTATATNASTATTQRMIVVQTKPVAAAAASNQPRVITLQSSGIQQQQQQQLQQAKKTPVIIQMSTPVASPGKINTPPPPPPGHVSLLQPRVHDTTPEPVSVPAVGLVETVVTETENKEDLEKLVKAQQLQDKANKIIQQAVAKAQEKGLTEIPKVVEPEALIDVECVDINKKKDKKPPRKRPSGDRKPKSDKEKKPLKEKKPPRERKLKPSKKKRPPATLLINKKRKRKSSEGSDVEAVIPSPHGSEDEELSGIEKRRSGRHSKRKRYIDTVDLNLSEEEDDTADTENNTTTPAVKTTQIFVDNPSEDEAIIVEKILGMRTRKIKRMKSIPAPTPAATDTGDEENVDVDNVGDVVLEEEEVEIEEFYVKYKNFSYLHCEWKSADLLTDKRIAMKIKRYKMKRMQAGTYFQEQDEDELFNADYIEVDRILEKAITIDPVTDEEVTHYMVKWQSLAYEDSTWELEQDVPNTKIEAYERYCHPPPEEDRHAIARPRADSWKKLDATPIYKNDNSLREYQLEGVNWLSFCWYNRQNCILADEMGLGKTIQSITFLKTVFDYGIKGPYLVIVPLSTLGNWQREFEQWTDMNVIVYHGSAISRSMLQEYEMYYKDEKGQRIPDLFKFNALITTYEVIISDVELLCQIDWRVTVIDEAHRLKNMKCKLHEGLKCFDLEHRVLLTGTPLQNNVEELFALLNFLEPQRFKSSEDFVREFGNLKTESQVDKLKGILKPMMLRRLKEDVEKSLAPKEETIIEVELTNIQKKYYRAILERNFQFLTKGGTTSNAPSLMNTMMELRKCCNHPFLIKGAEEQTVNEVKEQHGPNPEKVHEALVQASGKLVLIDKLLPKLKAGDHKVLVFSQMIRVLDILEDYLIHKSYPYERLDGRIRGNLRQEAIDRFSKPDSDRFVFLLCTRAGGLGINLTAADTVIIFDSDWNPQNDLQAQARCHRIGQQKSVKVYRLITRNSYEREMFDKASLKLGLDKAVLQSMNQQKNKQDQAQMTKKEIEDLLKKGAYGALMEDDTAGDQFCEEDIDQILQRRTQTITIDSEGKGSTFAKASFSASDNRDDINIDDPNFWEKWARKADLDADYLMHKNDLIIEQPRARKQTARYGNEDSILDMSDLSLDSEDSENNEYEEEDSKGKGKGKNKEKIMKRTRRSRKQKALDDAQQQIKDANPNGCYTRSEFFKVEKNLLVYGWGRWKDILLHGRFKRKLSETDAENMSRALIIYSLNHYYGDDRIKAFIWDLVNPAADSNACYKNHSGLSAPVPRGRKGRKAKKDSTEKSDQLREIMAKVDIDPERVITDEGYKKHLQRHANKVLLRVRLLYYLKQEVIGDEAEKVFVGLPANDIELNMPDTDGLIPVQWWDRHADKSLLIGTFKHGYEKYNIMRQDAGLCFLDRCGPPDGMALLAEQNDSDNEDTDAKLNAAPPGGKDDDEEFDEPLSPGRSTPASSSQNPKPVGEQACLDGKLPFPGISDLNTRLRRIITCYQRSHKKEQIKIQQKEKKMQKRQHFEAILKEREYAKRQSQQRWARREESDFYRVVSTYGVEFDKNTQQYNWERFRTLARLDRKFDETMTEYFLAFYYMCCKVCKKLKDGAIPPNDLYIEPITEERANRCLARVDLLNKIREDILYHPKLDAHLELCERAGDMPEWWIPGSMDRDLLIGAARWGLSRTDYHILNDPALSFREVYDAFKHELASEPAAAAICDKIVKEQSNEAAISEIVVKEENVAKDDNDSLTKVKQEETIGAQGKSDDDKSDLDSKPVKKEIDAKHETTEEHVKKEVGEDEVKEEITDVKTENDEQKMEVDKETTDVVESKDSESSESVKECKMEVESNAEEGETSKIRPETPQNDTDVDGNEGNMVNTYGQPVEENPGFGWPKDRTIFYRLEHICYCVEKGEWPVAKRFPSALQGESVSSTPVGTPIGTPTIDSTVEYNIRADTPDLASQVAMMMMYPEDLESEMVEGDGLKMTIQKKRKRRTKLEMEAERIVKLRELLGGRSSMQNMSSSSLAGGDLSSDRENDSDTNMTSLRIPVPHHRSEFLTNGAIEDYCSSRDNTDGESKTTIGRTSTPMCMGLGNSFKKKRGRKPKDVKLMEQRIAAAAASGSSSPRGHSTQINRHLLPLSKLGPDARIPVVSIEDGTRLTGEDAPKRSDLEDWLETHPGFMVDLPDELMDDELLMTSNDDQALHGGHHAHRNKQRRPRLDPTTLKPESLTGDENVSVINKVSGKRITGAKAPPLKHLAEWLQQNPHFYVDPKWSHLVKEKGNLPESLQSRLLKPSEKRGRKPAQQATLSQQMLAEQYTKAQMAALSAAANPALLAANMSKLPVSMASYANMAAMAANPMAYLAAYGLPVSTAVAGSSQSSKSKDGKDDGPEPGEKLPSSSAAASFPYLYSPLMYNSLISAAAAAQGLGNYSVPQNIMAQYAQLAQAQASMMNGVSSSTGGGGAASDSDEPAMSNKAKEDKPTTSGRRRSDAPQDLSMPKTTAATATKKSPAKSKNEKRSDYANSLDDEKPLDLKKSSKSDS